MLAKKKKKKLREQEENEGSKKKKKKRKKEGVGRGVGGGGCSWRSGWHVRFPTNMSVTLVLDSLILPFDVIMLLLLQLRGFGG